MVVVVVVITVEAEVVVTIVEVMVAVAAPALSPYRANEALTWDPITLGVGSLGHLLQT